MIQFLTACLATAPPLDIDAALDDVCERPMVIVAEADHLPVFEGPAPTLAVNVVLHDELVVDGETTTQGELGALLAHKAETARELSGGSFAGDLLLQVAVDTPARAVVATLHTAEAAGFHEIQLVGRSAIERPAPTYADPAFAATLDATRQLPPERRVRAYDEATEGILEACPPLLEALAERKTQPFEERCEQLPGVVAEALSACPHADHRKILTLFQYDPFPSSAVLTTRTTTLAPDGVQIEVGATERWATVWPRVEHGSTTRWVLAPY